MKAPLNNRAWKVKAPVQGFTGSSIEKAYRKLGHGRPWRMVHMFHKSETDCADILPLQIHVNAVSSPANISEEYHKTLLFTRELRRKQGTIIRNNRAEHT